MVADDYHTVLDHVDTDHVLALEHALIRIPSPTFKEHKVADYLADYMLALGMSVEMMEFQHPYDRSKPNARQPIGRLAGTGGGPSLMLYAADAPSDEVC